MAILSPSEMMVWLEQNQFLTLAQAETMRAVLNTFPDPAALAKDLVRREWLTPFQANQIAQGKHQELILGKYRIRDRIGDGSMGHVHKAWNPLLRQLVAVKTIHKDRVHNTTTNERFKREMHAAAKLKHPNIAFVLNADEDNGRPFLVMEYIDGINLSARVKKQGAVPITEAAEYIRQAALGLQHAFEHGIVHRDIKPANLMVLTNKGGDGNPIVKILDFGLARYESEQEHETRITQLGNLLGTVDYVAPEQAQNASGADIRADIYSLGCTMFYLLAAQPPFGGDSVIEKLGPRLTGEAPWVRTLNSEIPPGLEEIVRTMMARLPADRYQTPIEVAEALEPYAGASAAAPTPVVMAAPVEAEPEPPAPILAQPILTPPTPSRAANRNSDTKPQRPGPAARLSLPWLMAFGVGGVLLSFGCLGACMLWYPTTPPKRAAIIITDAKLSTPSQVVKPGESKFVLVYIERVNFEGPVTISMRDLPAGVVGKSKVIPANGASADVSFTVSVGTDPIATKIRIVAQCDAAAVVGERMLPFTIVPEKKGRP